MPREAPFAPGSIVGGRYRIERLLAQGGMSRVYIAYHMQLDAHMALKEMVPPAGQATQAAQALFLQEARTLRQLRHPSLPVVHDAFSEQGRFFLAMDFVPGETLEAVRARRGPIPEPEVRRYLEQLCDVLDYLHSQSPPVIFRDLKPGNIILQPDGQLKLIDFGIARSFKARQSYDTTILGTPGYCPPEQYGQSQTDARSDIYALGKLAWALVTGRDPAQEPGGSLIARPARQLVPVVSPQLDALIQWATQLEPSKRPASAAAFRQALQQPAYNPSQTSPTQRVPPSIAPTGQPTIPSAPPHRPRYTGLVLFGGVVAILLLGGFLMLGMKHRLSFIGVVTTPTAQPTSAPTATNLPPTATATATATPSPAQEAQATVQAYYNDINQQDYQGAYNIWGTSYQNAHPYNQFANGYANTLQDSVTISAITVRPDGTVQVGLTIQAREQTASGTTTSTFQGSYIVGQENGAWKFLSANIQQVS
jgi:serine/threonine protein kinase